MPQTGLPEVETEEERGEVSEFLQEVIQSPPMQKLYQLLQQKGHLFAGSPSTFRSSLQQLWFGQYSRAKGEPDSSGFEHVFIGEVFAVFAQFNFLGFSFFSSRMGRCPACIIGFASSTSRRIRAGTALTTWGSLSRERIFSAPSSSAGQVT